MQSLDTPPFIRPDERAIQSSPWQTGNHLLQDRMVLPAWDASTSLTLTRNVWIDLGLTAATARLVAGTRLALVPTWWSIGTGLRGSGQRYSIVVNGSRSARCELSLRLPGAELRDSVQIRTSLVLLEVGPGSADPLSATMPGSVLWADRVSLALSPDTARFPVTAIDFVANGLGEPGSCWRLDWSPRALDAPAVATLRLWINTGHTNFHEAVTAGGRGPGDAVIRDSLRAALAFEMLRLALADADILANDTFEEGSTGRVFQDLINHVFSGLGVRETARLLEEDPGRFAATVQARMNLYGISVEPRTAP